ncbi:MAG: FAD-dependent protein [Bacteroidota bacterium]
MIHRVELKLFSSEIKNDLLIKEKAIAASKANPNDVKAIIQIRRSIDARPRRPVFRLLVEVYVNEDPPQHNPILSTFSKVENRPEVIVVGAGPAGYFAALELIELGFRPLVFDRGKTVRERRKDLRAIQQFATVNPDSNYCFGEGGAGTYSDGKLYTRSLKRGNYKKVLDILVEHGANPEILIDAHPHIGSNKLPGIVQAIRETIEKYGGQVFFNSKVTDLIIEKQEIKGIIVNNDKTWLAAATILATGHSARDIFYLLDGKKVKLSAKPFALGVRVEHPQALIDEIQYRQNPREDGLPAASYKLVCQVSGRGVFSFCMCPGGLVVPAATSPGEIVVNGMSLSRRDSKYANSGIVVAVETADLKQYKKYGLFAGLIFQKEVEQAMFAAGDGSQKAPAMRMTDFCQNKLSASLNDSSYIPGLHSAPLNKLLPGSFADRLQQAFRTYEKNMKGYYTAEANVIGVESRTSSPIRIPRNKMTYMHDDVVGLFPCGEGAGYAGGILSAAMDGQNVAKAVAQFLT